MRRIKKKLILQGKLKKAESTAPSKTSEVENIFNQISSIVDKKIVEDVNGVFKFQVGGKNTNYI